ncbi:MULTISPECIES: FAD-binding oxidoreductase [Nocardia]|uniref:NAD(P)/FAD-dependent oxidoreductase n=1 Tax=Nocardia TaxID=1817 RepID=UPI00313A804F
MSCGRALSWDRHPVDADAAPGHRLLLQDRRRSAAQTRHPPYARSPTGSDRRCCHRIGCGRSRPHLRLGAQQHPCTFIDLDVRGAGVTGSAFGWIGATHTSGGSELQRDAIADFHALDAELEGALSVSWAGSLTWFPTPKATESFVRTQQGRGFPTEAVDAEGFTRLEPALGSRPEIAAYAPYEGAVAPGRIRRTLLAAARDLDARVVEAAVSESAVGIDGRAPFSDAGVFHARYVVLANGLGAPRLAAQVGTALAVESSPAIRYTFRTNTPLSRRVLSGPDYEIRPWHRGAYLGAEDYVTSEDPHRPVKRVHQALDAIRRDLGVRNPPQLIDFRVGFRPVPTGGRPYLGALRTAPQVLVACMHPGITLAPHHRHRRTRFDLNHGVPMENHNTALACPRGLHYLRPTRRLVFVESAVGLLLGAATLPQSYPPAGESPMWAQLLGLSFLLTALCANLYLWQRIVAAGVGLRFHTAAISAERQLREFILDERRLRIATIVYAAAIGVLVPLPPSWRWFWFIFTLLATALTAVSLRRMWCVEVRGPGDGSRTTTRERGWWSRW